MAFNQLRLDMSFQYFRHDEQLTDMLVFEINRFSKPFNYVSVFPQKESSTKSCVLLKVRVVATKINS